MPNRPSGEYATVEELSAAITGMTKAELLRLYKKGEIYKLGTEFADGMELLNEAVKRALIGTSGERRGSERGRPWPKSVDIVAFLMECMRSVADGSMNSVNQQVARKAEALVDEEGEANPHLAEHDGYHSSVEDDLIEQEQALARQAKAAADVAVIDKHFANDQEVLGVLEGEKDELPVAEVREIFGMSQTAYDSARRRLRRNADQLFPGRKK